MVHNKNFKRKTGNAFYLVISSDIISWQKFVRSNCFLLYYHYYCVTIDSTV